MLFIYAQLVFFFFVAFWLQLVKKKIKSETFFFFVWRQKRDPNFQILIFHLRKGKNVRNCRLSFFPDIPNPELSNILHPLEK